MEKQCTHYRDKRYMIVSIFRINSETLENNSFWGLEESIGWTDRRTGNSYKYIGGVARRIENRKLTYAMNL